MSAIDLLRDARANLIEPALPDFLRTKDAVWMLLAIGGTESGFRFPIQRGEGGTLLLERGARGYWQFERETVGLVLRHERSSHWLWRFVPNARADDIWRRLAWDGPLACVLARALLYSDPSPLPTAGDVRGGAEYYKRLWRPGVFNWSRWRYWAEKAAVAVEDER